jgi:hypothetical protein
MRAPLIERGLQSCQCLLRLNQGPAALGRKALHRMKLLGYSILALNDVLLSQGKPGTRFVQLIHGAHLTAVSPSRSAGLSAPARSFCIHCSVGAPRAIDTSKGTSAV